MDFNRTEALLDKYFEGKSTEMEERELQQQMLSPDLPEHLKESAVLFQFYQHQRASLILDSSFDEALVAQLEIGPGAVRPSKKHLDWGFYLRIAASVIIVFSVGFLLMKNPIQMNAMKEDTYDDPQKAYEETKKALMLISAKMNEGTEKVQSQLESFAEAQKAIEKQ